MGVMLPVLARDSILSLMSQLSITWEEMVQATGLYSIVHNDSWEAF